MPAAVLIPAIASVMGGGLAYAGARSAAGASQRAASGALAFQREQEEQRRREYEDRQRLERERQEELDRRREPYRQASLQVLSNWGYGSPIDHAPTPPVGVPSRGTLGSLLGRG